MNIEFLRHIEPLSKGRRKRGCRKYIACPAIPPGSGKAGLLTFQVKPPHIGGGLVGVDVSFGSFLCAREREQIYINFLK